MHLVCKIKPNGAEIRPIDDSTGSLILTAVLLLFPLFFKWLWRKLSAKFINLHIISHYANSSLIFSFRLIWQKQKNKKPSRKLKYLVMMEQDTVNSSSVISVYMHHPEQVLLISHTFWPWSVTGVIQYTGMVRQETGRAAASEICFVYASNP